MKTIGTTAALWRYPVKSLAAQPLDSVDLASDGFPGDRSRALLIESQHAREGKTYRGKENNLLHLTSSEETAVARALDRNVSVRLIDAEPHYFDAAPVSVIFERWLKESSALVGYPLEPLRFRPNILVAEAADFLDQERDLCGMVLTIGHAKLRVRKPIERCVTTTYDLHTGESDPNVLRQIAQKRGTFLGIYCDVETPGSIRVGDAVRSELFRH